MDFHLLVPSDRPFHSFPSFNMISIDGIHFAVVVARGVAEFEYITKLPYCFQTQESTSL